MAELECDTIRHALGLTDSLSSPSLAYRMLPAQQPQPQPQPQPTSLFHSCSPHSDTPLAAHAKLFVSPKCHWTVA